MTRDAQHEHQPKSDTCYSWYEKKNHIILKIYNKLKHTNTMSTQATTSVNGNDNDTNTRINEHHDEETSTSING